MLEINFINFTAGGESGHEVNGQLPIDHNTSSSQPNAKSHSFSRSKY